MLQKSNHKINKGQWHEWLYCFTFGLWYFFEILFQTRFTEGLGTKKDLFNELTSYLVFVLLLILVLFGHKYTLKEMVIICILTLIVSVSSMNSNLRMLICGWMFIVAARDMDFYKLAKTAYFMLIVSLLLVFLMCRMGMLEDYTVYRGSILRHSLGFTHPNQLGLRLFQIAACHCYLRWKKYNVIDFFTLIGILWFIYKITNSQTAFLCTILLYTLVFLAKIISKKHSVLVESSGAFLMIGGMAAAVLSVICTYIDITSSAFLMKLNSAVSSRFSLGHQVYALYGSSLFGQKIYVSSEERKIIGLSIRLWLDSAYANLWLRGGVVMLLLFCMAYFMTLYKFRHVPVVSIILFTYAVYGITEMGLIQLTHNVFLLLMAWTLYPSKQVNTILDDTSRHKIHFTVRQKKFGDKAECL